jgi:hypothetical protein
VSRRRIVLGLLALATGAGLAVAADPPAKDPDRPLAFVVGAMDALRDFNTRACTIESPGVLDVKEIGRRALGRHAHDLNRAEVAEFGELVARRLLRWYAGVLDRERSAPGSAASADPIFGTATAIGSWAAVSAITPGRRRTFVYHLRWTDDGPWRLYDIEANGRSRIRAYYTEFDRIILNEGYRVLARRLRTEVDETRRADNGARTDRCRTVP